MPIQTSYAELDIPFTLISTIVFKDDHATITIVFRNGDRIQGTSNLNELKIETLVGKVAVVKTDIVSISIAPDTSTISEGLVAHYPLDANAEDASGNGDHGRVHGTTGTTDRFDVPNGALLFGGSGDYIDLGTDSLLNPTASMTITAWIRPVDGGARSNIISRWETREHGEGERTFTIGLRPDNTLYWIVSPDGSHSSAAEIASGDPLPLSSWSFVAATWDGSTISLFKNAVRLASDEMPAMKKSPHVRTSIGAAIGREGDPTLGVFHGAIDDVRFYSRSLSEQEIQALYNGK